MTAIRSEALAKQYRLGGSAPRATLRERLTRGLSPSRWLRWRGRQQPPTIWALRDVTFDVPHGQVVGVIGRNGAGKSTLLKVLSRITEPTAGRVEVRGRIGSLLEVGTGFHAELSGRDNIYMNGAILGMRRAEIRRNFDAIVAFAEVERFIDTPVKHYSSGMYLRLAFAVAAHLDPEILLVDEVLAVGDAGFQRKCLGKMGEVAGSGRTVLFVSHNMAAVEKLCSRVMLFAGGELAADGPSADVVRRYIASFEQAAEGALDVSGRRSSATVAKVVDAWFEIDGARTRTFLWGSRVDVFLQIEVFHEEVFGIELVLRQADDIPVAFGPSGFASDWQVRGKPGMLLVKATLPPLELAAGNYSLDLILAETNEVRFLDYIQSALAFTIDSTAIGDRSWDFTQSSGQGCFLWHVDYEVVSPAGVSSGT